MQGSFTRRLHASRTLDFAGLWPLNESVKNVFACGGLRVCGHSAWLPCCLPAADRVVWLCFRRYGFSFSSEACYGVVELNHGIVLQRPVMRVSCRLCVWTHDSRPQLRLSSPRGMRRAVRHRNSRGSLCIRRLLLLFVSSLALSTRRAAFLVGLALVRRDMLVICVRVF